MRPTNFPLLLILMALASCETVVDYEVPFEKPHIVVNALLNADSTVSVNITKSNFILNDSREYKPLEHANVKLLADGAHVSTLKEDSGGVYSSSYVPKHGEQLALEVSHENYNVVKATTVVPVKGVDFKVLRFAALKSKNQWNRKHIIDIEVDDPPGHQYYAISLYARQIVGRQPDGQYIADTTYRKIHISSEHPEVIDPGFNSREALFKDDLFDGRKFQFRLEFHQYIEDTDLIVELKTTDEAYYRYFASVYKQGSVDNDPLAEPVQIYNNVENGLGIFSSYVISREVFSP